MLFQHTFFSLNTLPHTSIGLTRCISSFFSFEYFDSFDRYAACLDTPSPVGVYVINERPHDRKLMLIREMTRQQER